MAFLFGFWVDVADVWTFRVSGLKDVEIFSEVERETVIEALQAEIDKGACC